MLEATKPPSESRAETIWVSRIRLWGFVAEEKNQLDRDPNALGYSELVWRLRWRRRVLVERRILKEKNGFKGSLGFAAGPFA
jgi:hypothetical protein